MQPAKTCPQCQTANDVNAFACIRCGHQFGSPYAPTSQPGMPGYGAYQPVPMDSSKKTSAGICGILLGGLGIHKFILGYNKAGIIMLCVSLLSCGLLAPVMSVIGFIEGIIYLSKSDMEFYQTYIVSTKDWF